MSSNNTQAVSSEVVIDGLSELMAKQAELKALKRQVKEQNELEAWEAKVSARNPSYVRGSVRKATVADQELLGHAHGKVCQIKCQECGELRTVNLQDAFQCRYCLNCRKVAQRAAAKAKRATQKVERMDRATLESKIAEMQALLAQKAA